MKDAKKNNKGTLASSLPDLYTEKEKRLEIKPVLEQPKMRVSRGLQHAMQEGYKHGDQLSIIFDELEARTQDKMRQLNVNEKEAYFGIDLDGDGWEIMEVLELLQYLHSNTTDQTRPDYYLGDPNTTEIQTLEWAGEQKAVGFIYTTLAELTKIRIGKAKPAGSDLKKTESMLMKYTDQRFLLRYKEHYTETKPSGKTRSSWRTIVGYTMLYKAVIAKDNGTKSSIVKIWLSPAFYYQIAKNYDEKPQDFLDRVRNTYAEVSGIGRKQMPTYLLPFLNQLVDAQHYQDCIYHCKAIGKGNDKGLYNKLNNSWVRARRWKDLDALLGQFIEVAKRIGLLKKYWEEVSMTTGEKVLYFEVVPAGEWK